MIALAPSFQRTGSALHAARASIAVAYIAALCTVALVYDHPLVLACALAAVVAAGVAAGVGAELRRAARLAVPLALVVALINPLVSQNGLTVLVEGPVLPVLGNLDVTLEAVVYGGIAGLRVLVVVLAFALYSAAVDPDDVLGLLRRLSFRSALTASLATRLVPALGRDAERLGDAYLLRAAAPAGDEGGLARVRRSATLTRALAAGALERAVDMAAALEVRGYALASPLGHATRSSPWSRHDLGFALAALAVAAICLCGLIAGLAGFEAYPELRAGLGPADLGLALAVPLAALAPFLALQRRARRGGGDG
jgi:energy-coupling factor transport system permease protein